MKYKSFRIRNFKGIKALTLDFSSDPKTQIYTLVGLNESGKTTLLEAINMFAKDFPADERYKLIPKSQSLNFNDEISVEATLTLEEEDIKEIETRLSESGFKPSAIPSELIIEKTYRFEKSEFKEAKTYWTFEISGKKGKSKKETKITVSSEEFKPITEYINVARPPILYYENFLFEFPKRIFLEDKDGLPRQKIKNQMYRDILQDVLDSLDQDLNLNEHILERLKQQEKADTKASLKAVIKRMGSKISQVVLEAWQDLFDSRGKEIVVETGQDPESGYYIELTLSDGSETYDIADRSLGFKWFFTFLLFTEFRKNRAKDKGEILFLLDEPASNLHSTAQQKLLKKFDSLVQPQAHKSRCKLVYTTHSHHLINPGHLSGTYIVRNKALKLDEEFQYDASKTDIEVFLYRRFVADYPDQRDYFKPILDCLEYQPGLLEAVPSIIVTEGKNDYYTFLYMQEVIFGDEFQNLHFYPGCGAEQNDDIIRLYTSWGRDYTVLLDGDRAGLKAKKRYIIEIGPAVEGRIFTLQDVDASWNGATEHLFTENDRKEITKRYKLAALGFEKGPFYTAILNLWSDKETFNFEEETLQNFRKLFVFLNTSLPSPKLEVVEAS